MRCYHFYWISGKIKRLRECLIWKWGLGFWLFCPPLLQGGFAWWFVAAKLGYSIKTWKAEIFSPHILLPNLPVSKKGKIIFRWLQHQEIIRALNWWNLYPRLTYANMYWCTDMCWLAPAGGHWHHCWRHMALEWDMDAIVMFLSYHFKQVGTDM